MAAAKTTYWFSNDSCVLRGPERWEVFVAGTLVGEFTPGDRVGRDPILVGLLQDPNRHEGRLARAFGTSVAALRRLRRLYEAEGMVGVARTGRRGARRR